KDGRLSLLFLDYNEQRLAYEYVVHRSALTNFDFTKETLLQVYSERVLKPLDRNYYNRDFNSGFTTTALFNEEKSAFVISTHFRKGKVNKHMIHLFNTSLEKL